MAEPPSLLWLPLPPIILPNLLALNPMIDHSTPLSFPITVLPKNIGPCSTQGSFLYCWNAMFEMLIRDISLEQWWWWGLASSFCCMPCPQSWLCLPLISLLHLLDCAEFELFLFWLWKHDGCFLLFIVGCRGSRMFWLSVQNVYWAQLFTVPTSSRASDCQFNLLQIPLVDTRSDYNPIRCLNEVNSCQTYKV